MTSDQIKLLKESYYKKTKTPDGSRDTTLGEYTKFCLDGGIEFVSGKDIVVYDDANEMLHCMCLNSDAITQANFPIKVISSSYEWVQQVESILSRNNFETLLNEGFLSSILSDSQKEFIKKWAKTIGKIQAQQPSDAEPYYTQEPTVIPMYTKFLKRDDGITYPTSPATMNYEKNPKPIKAVSTPEALKEALAEGADVFVSQPMTISEVMPISGNTVINLGEGANIISTDTTRPFEMEDGATLTINGGDAVVEVGKYGLVNIKDGSNASVVLNGGTYIANTDNGSFIKPRGNGNISVAMTGVNYVDESDSGFVINSANTGMNEDGTVNTSFNIKDCTLTSARGIQVAGDIEIRNCTINSSLQGIEVTVTNKPAIIDNCTFVNTASTTGPVPSTCVGIGNGAESNIRNCTFDSANHAIFVASDSTVNVTDCEFINGDIKNDVGVVCIDGKYAVSSVKAMERAITLGDNILIGSDMTMDSTVSVTNDMVIDFFKDANLNTDPEKVNRPFEMANESSLTINAAGKEITLGKYGLVNIPVESELVDITLNGGTYKSNMDNGAIIKPRGVCKSTIKMIDVTCVDESNDSFIVNVNDMDIYNSRVEMIVEGGTYTCANGFQCPAGTIMKNATLNIKYTAIETNGYENEFTESTFDNCVFNVSETVNNGNLPTPTAIGAGHYSIAVINNCTIDSVANALYVYSTPGIIRANNCNIINGKLDNTYGEIYIDGVLVA